MGKHFEGGSLKTAAKLVILEEYLDAYTTIMDNNWSGELWYVDTHAGTGRTEIDDYGTTIDGSALRAIENHSDSFDGFYLYELDPGHFETLHETLAKKFDIQFDVGPARVEDHNFPVARSEDPKTRILQMDSNDGVSFLAENSHENRHWFTFVDPKGLTAKRSTLDTLIQRSNMDILINYQTTGVMRSAAEGAEHAHDAVNRTHGDDDWPTDGDVEEYIDLYRNKLGENPSISPVISKKMVSPFDKSHRFDLVFASTNRTARKIMGDIMTQDDLWSKANDEVGQSGLGDF